MNGLLIALVVVAVLVLLGLALSVRIVQQYEKGVLFRLGRVVGVREPGLRLIVPVVEVLRRVSLRIVTMPIQSQGIITRDNVSVDVSAVVRSGPRSSPPRANSWPPTGSGPPRMS
jgi:regulator of protease activity HflC (stomatin/prohibitin superfamily)